jgi:hypothetical protein
VDDFVVRDRQDEFLAPGVHERKRDQLVVVAPVHGIERACTSSVSFIQPMFHLKLNPNPPYSGGWVTPANEVDSSAIISAPGNSRCTAQFSLAQEIDRLQIFAAAVPVRQPIAGIATVIQIQHRRHRVDAQTVDMEAIHPKSALATRKLRTSWRP